MDKFEEKEMKKIRPIKSTWNDWLINYIPEPIRKSVGGFEDKFVSLLTQTHLNNPYMGGKETKQTQNTKQNYEKRRKKNIDRIEGIIRNIWTLYEKEKEKRERN